MGIAHPYFNYIINQEEQSISKNRLQQMFPNNTSYTSSDDSLPDNLTGDYVRQCISMTSEQCKDFQNHVRNTCTMIDSLRNPQCRHSITWEKIQRLGIPGNQNDRFQHVFFEGMHAVHANIVSRDMGTKNMYKQKCWLCFQPRFVSKKSGLGSMCHSRLVAACELFEACASAARCYTDPTRDGGKEHQAELQLMLKGVSDKEHALDRVTSDIHDFQRSLNNLPPVQKGHRNSNYDVEIALDYSDSDEDEFGCVYGDTPVNPVTGRQADEKANGNLRGFVVDDSDENFEEEDSEDDNDDETNDETNKNYESDASVTKQKRIRNTVEVSDDESSSCDDDNGNDDVDESESSDSDSCSIYDDDESESSDSEDSLEDELCFSEDSSSDEEDANNESPKCGGNVSHSSVVQKNRPYRRPMPKSFLMNMRKNGLGNIPRNSTNTKLTPVLNTKDLSERKDERLHQAVVPSPPASVDTISTSTSTSTCHVSHENHMSPLVEDNGDDSTVNHELQEKEGSVPCTTTTSPNPKTKPVASQLHDGHIIMTRSRTRKRLEATMEAKTNNVPDETPRVIRRKRKFSDDCLVVVRRSNRLRQNDGAYGSCMVIL